MLKLGNIIDWTDVLEFTDEYNLCIWKKDNRARESLNKTLETNFKAVYRKTQDYKKQWRAGGVYWDGEEFYAITSKGRVLRFTNSEWGGVEVLK